MKFSEKLQKLRKTNNLSQEQLADMLEVTRQSVSKWESGQTYPEMDKLISMCKIFKCSLDDLTNDEISDKTILENKKSNMNTLVDNILELITKTYHMFKNMSTTSLIKCIITMLIIAVVLLLFKIPFNYLSDQLYLIFSVIPNKVIEGLLTNVFNLIINLCYAALYIFLLIYIFKIGYLDKYKNIEVEKETNDNKSETKASTKESIKVEVEKTKKENENHHSDAIFNFLGKIIMFIIKFFVVCFTIPFIFSLLGLSVSFAVVFLLLFKKIIYIGVLLGIIFAIILNVLVIKLVIDFLFNRKVNAKCLFITFVVGIIGVGVSSGIFCLEIASTKYIDAAPKEATIKVENKIIDFENNMFYPNNYHKDVEYKIDSSLTNTVKLELHYYDKYTSFNINKYQDGNYIAIENHQYVDEKGWNIIELLMKDLSKKELHNYSKLYNQKLIIYSSEANINKMKNNYTNCNKERAAIESRLEAESSRYDETIEELNERIYELEQNNTTYEEEKRNLEEKNEELQNKINEYKDRIKDMINE